MRDVKILDVQKLNQLILFIDKTWILPDPGASQPIGSNFKVNYYDKSFQKKDPIKSLSRLSSNCY